MSWELKEWIKIPALRKITDLKNACIIKWKKDNEKRPNPKILIIKPNWLRVDRAITFLKSISKNPDSLLINIVIREIININIISLLFIYGTKRINK